MFVVQRAHQPPYPDFICNGSHFTAVHLYLRLNSTYHIRKLNLSDFCNILFLGLRNIHIRLNSISRYVYACTWVSSLPRATTSSCLIFFSSHTPPPWIYHYFFHSTNFHITQSPCPTSSGILACRWYLQCHPRRINSLGYIDNMETPNSFSINFSTKVFME